MDEPPLTPAQKRALREWFRGEGESLTTSITGEKRATWHVLESRGLVVFDGKQWRKASPKTDAKKAPKTPRALGILAGQRWIETDGRDSTEQEEKDAAEIAADFACDAHDGHLEFIVGFHEGVRRSKTP